MTTKLLMMILVLRIVVWVVLAVIKKLLIRDDGLSSVDIKSETETLRPDSPDDLSEYLTSSRREDLQEVPLEVLPLWDLILELGRIEGKK